MPKKLKKLRRTPRVLLAPYIKGSKSVRNLREQLRGMGLRVRTIYNRSVNPRNLVVRWGSSRARVDHDNVINIPQGTSAAADKIASFRAFERAGVQCPKWTTDKEVAKTFRFPVVCRTLTRASEGKGIVIAETVEDLVNAPLYTEYKKKRSEYRVHVANDAVLDVQEKRRRRGYEGRNNQIRNSANGWVFCRDDVRVPQEAKDLAIKAVTALGLHFGAVDLIYNERENQYYVLEVNTAPGIEGTTVINYATFIKNEFKRTTTQQA